MNAPGSFRFLDWDSEHFGVRIGSLTGARAISDVDAALDLGRREGVECLYALVPSEDLALINALEAHAARLVDVRMTLDARVANAARPASIRVCRADDIAALRSIASFSHTASRFYADGRFARAACDDLYAKWIEKSCGGWADLVLVADHEGRPSAYLSCHVRDDGRGEIGLLAVAPEARGLGLGNDLVEAALAFFAERGVSRASVVTQGRNIAAQRLYQAHGFRTARVELWYHLWLDESARRS